MAQENIKNPELAKIYFMGFAKKEMRIRNIECYLEDLKARRLALAAICEEGEQAVFSSLATGGFSAKEERDIFTYQLAAARYGRDFLQFHIAWYERLLSEMKEKEGSL